MIWAICLILLFSFPSQSNDCSDLPNNSTIRLDAIEMPLDGVRPMNQDSTGLCSYYTLSKILQPHLPFMALGRTINPNYLGVLGYQLNKKSKIKSYTDKDGDGFYDGANLCQVFDKLKSKKLCMENRENSISTRRFSEITKGLDQLYEQLSSLSPEQKDYLVNKSRSIKCDDFKSKSKFKESLTSLISTYEIQRHTHSIQFVALNDQIRYADLLVQKQQTQNQAKHEESEYQFYLELIISNEQKIEELEIKIIEIESKIEEIKSKTIDHLSPTADLDYLQLELQTKKTDLDYFQRDKLKQEVEASTILERIQKTKKEVSKLEILISDLEKSFQDQIDVNPHAKQLSSQYKYLTSSLRKKKSQLSPYLPFSCNELEKELQLTEFKSLSQKFVIIRNVQSLKSAYINECEDDISKIEDELDRPIPSYSKIKSYISNCKINQNINQDFFEYIPSSDDDFPEIKKLMDTCEKKQLEQKKYLKKCFKREIADTIGSPIEQCHPIFESSNLLFQLSQTSDEVDDYINKINRRVDSFIDLQFPYCKDPIHQLRFPKLRCNETNLYGSIENRKQRSRETILSALKAKSPRPLGISYCANQLHYNNHRDMVTQNRFNTDEKRGSQSCGNHASTVIGAKCENGKISYLVLNSWGDSFEPFENEHITPGSKRKIASGDVESYGKFWIPEEDFAKMVYEIQDIK